MPASGPNGFYFPYDPDNNRFDFSSYNTEFCEARVSVQELEAINASLQQIPPPPIGCPCRQLMALLTLLVTAGLMVGLGLYFHEGKVPINETNFSYLRKYKYVNVDPMHIGILLGASAALGLGMTIYLLCSSCSQVASEQDAFNVRLTNLFNRHQQTVLGPKQMTLRLSPYQTYMSIAFNWKVAQAPAQPGLAMGLMHRREREFLEQELMFGDAAGGGAFNSNAQAYGMHQPGQQFLGPPVFS